MLTDSGIDVLASAIFEKPSPWVAEAYSAFDVEPIQFASAVELAQYTRQAVEKPLGMAHFFVVYPDMGGFAVRETVQLTPGSVPGHTLRYTWQGWGLISVQLMRTNHPPYGSHISANSQARATKWAATYPDWESPSRWNWRAVASHTRRLQRVLKATAR